MSNNEYTPTPEQIKAAAKAAHKAAMEHCPGMIEALYGWDVLNERDREGYMLQARAALVAAAGVTPGITLTHKKIRKRTCANGGTGLE